jgi:hypothetical protein
VIVLAGLGGSGDKTKPGRRSRPAMKWQPVRASPGVFEKSKCVGDSNSRAVTGTANKACDLRELLSHNKDPNQAVTSQDTQALLKFSRSCRQEFE